MPILRSETMTVKEAKREYNKQLKRYEKAIEYFDSNAMDKEQYLSDFQKLLMGLSKLLKSIGVYAQEEVWRGFKE